MLVTYLVYIYIYIYMKMDGQKHLKKANYLYRFTCIL